MVAAERPSIWSHLPLATISQVYVMAQAPGEQQGAVGTIQHINPHNTLRSCNCLLQVPYRLLKAFHKVQQRLVRELEKKFSGKDVVLIANRRVMPTPSSGKSIARPRSRTLTAVRLPILGHAAFHSVMSQALTARLRESACKVAPGQP